MNATSQDLHFSKMHGLGNDFVVLDVRNAFEPTPALCRFLADRRHGIGCDLILGIAPPRTPSSVASYRIWTPDGRASQQCGNGARCVAAWVNRAGLTHGLSFALDSPSGTHAIDRVGADRFRVALGVPDFSPSAIPLAGFEQEQDDYQLDLDGLPAFRFAAVSIGNPHVVIEVEDVATAPMTQLGPRLREAPCLPDSVNVGVAQVLSETRIRLRVDEFGAGETLACGSGACAAAAVLMRTGRVARDIIVSLAGGDLEISWPGPAHEITMTGPATFVFDGWIPKSITTAHRTTGSLSPSEASAISGPGIYYG